MPTTFESASLVQLALYDGSVSGGADKRQSPLDLEREYAVSKSDYHIADPGILDATPGKTL